MVSTATTMDDDASSSSSEEDVYSPFTYKEDDGIVVAGNGLFEVPPITADILTAKEAPHPAKSIVDAFSHLNIYQGKCEYD
jgi:hypothetical protein